MNLEAQIRPELWDAVKSSYQATNYTHAIRDAMVVITATLRDRSGIDGDGDELVGKALGLKNDKPPLIKINPLQTQTEKDIQQGLLLVLQGMYALVRNPRSHEKLDDSKETADSIILFVNYLIGPIGGSQQSFTIQEFIVKIKDRYFVRSDEYSQEIVETIPVRKRLDTLIQLYREKHWDISPNIKIIVRRIIATLSDYEINEFVVVISEDLQKSPNNSNVSLIISVIPDNLWFRIQKMPKMRAENMLIESLNNAWYSPNNDNNNSAAATWITNIAKHFTMKRNLQDKILNNLSQEDFEYHSFIAKYFMNVLPDIFDTESSINQCVEAISESIRAGNEFVKDRVKDFLTLSPRKEWVKLFVENLKDLTDPEKPEIYLPENGPRSPKTIPFLGKFVPQPNPVGDVP